MECYPNLEVLDIGNNHIEDVFPYYLRKISRLRVLVLRSNNFHGSIGCGGTNVTWPMLQIIDLALNNFTGQLPRKSSSTWKASNLLRFLKIPMKGTKDYADSLNKKCAVATGTRSPLPTFEETHLNPGIVIDWNVVSAELGFVFGLGIVIGPLMFWKRWRTWYYKHVDDILFSIFPQLYVGKEYHQRRA